MPNLHEVVKDADALVALEPEELGSILLHVLAGRQDRGGKFHPGNFEGELFNQSVNRYPTDRQAAVLTAIREAFAWLEGQALIVPPDPTDGRGGWRVLSRRGRRLADPDKWADHRQASLLPKPLLHPQIADGVYFDFMRGDYQSAVFKAFRDVEIAVRDASGIPDVIGVKLMRDAFSPKTGPLADSKADGGEQQGLSDLFAGAIGSYKNPHSHRRVDLDASDAVEMLMLASHLRRIIDSRRKK